MAAQTRLFVPPPFEIDESVPAQPAAAAPGTGTRVWLVRHADVAAQWHGHAYGNLDVPLSERGEQQTQALGEAFRDVALAQVHSSDLSRARAMGSAIAQATQAPLRLDPRLREIWRGEWQGLSSSEFRRRWELDRQEFMRDPWNWKGHRGESDADVFDRAWPALLESVHAHAGKRIALTSHYNVIRVLASRALGLNPRESFGFVTDPAHAVLLIDAPQGWQLVAHNLAVPGPHSGT